MKKYSDKDLELARQIILQVEDDPELLEKDTELWNRYYWALDVIRRSGSTGLSGEVL